MEIIVEIGECSPYFMPRSGHFYKYPQCVSLGAILMI